MSNMKRIACFFTAGYTEINFLKIFLGKINDTVEYIQLCPTGKRRRKNNVKCHYVDNISQEQSGLTGRSLIQYILKFIKTETFQKERYDAILIEDDKDDRFLEIDPNGFSVFNQTEWADFKITTNNDIKKICPNIPVIYFFAAPEIETWFIADFDNSFGMAYRTILTYKENKFFKIRFCKYINKFIITKQYKKCIEEYGYFNGSYLKLSTQIQKALDENDFLEDFNTKTSLPIISYSKRYIGQDMLSQIDPDTVLKYCTIFFKEGYNSLKKV